jgi:hypothetical protein
MCTGIVLYTKLAQACESVDLACLCTPVWFETMQYPCTSRTPLRAVFATRLDADSTGAVCGRCVRVQLLSVTDRREARKRSHKQKVRVRAYNV